MKKILFIGNDLSLSHIVRPLFLATLLSKKGYDVVFASGGKYASLIKITGIKHRKIPFFSGVIKFNVPFLNKGEIKTIFVNGKKLLEKIKPDLVVGDSEISFSFICENLKIPYALITNSCNENIWIKESSKKSWFKYHFSLLWEAYSKPWRKIGKSMGLVLSGNSKKAFSSNYVIYADAPSFYEAKIFESDKNIRYIGPITWFPPVKMPTWWNKMPKDKPLVYVSMGSSGEAAVLEKIIHAIKDLPVVIVMTTAKKVSLEKKYNDVYVADYLPGEKVIRKASLVICNGGNGAIYQALKFRVPILAFPNNVDQRINTEIIVEKKIGMSLDHLSATSREIKTAIEKLLKNKKYKKSAEKMALEIGKYDAKKEFLKFIDDWEDRRI